MTERPNQSNNCWARLPRPPQGGGSSRPTYRRVHQLNALEGFLDRLGASPYASSFVLKGSVLLAAYEARRPTRDIDLAAIDIADDLVNIHRVVNEIISANPPTRLGGPPISPTRRRSRSPPSLSRCSDSPVRSLSGRHRSSGGTAER